MKKALIIILVLCTQLLWAQNNEPKVGLVLSGGGAKGFGHIGALKVIDSLGIKVDYISGTSMGAVIGSLYASGYSGKQLDSLFNEVNFDELINDFIPRSSKSFFERNNDEEYAVTLPFDDFKIQLPSAISRGQNVFNLLSRLLIHVSDVDRFDQLPIPFFCVATNIETGEAIIMDQGSLTRSVLASGAFPSLFQPVVIDDQILIDGGVVNNYPIEELRAKGMDFIIGVDVQDDLANRDDLKTAPDILLQINNFRTINDMKDKAVLTDIYIKPDISDFNVISFDEGGEIIQKGVEAANEKIEELVALKEQSFRSSKRRHISIKDSILIKGFSVKGNKNYTRSYVLGKLKLRPNEKVSYERFIKGINNLVATNNFDSFLYDLVPRDDGYDMLADVIESEKTTFLKFGVHYDNLYKSAALLNFTKKRALFDNDVLSVDVILGDNVRCNFEYFIDKGFYWSVGLRSRYNEFHKNINASLILTEDELALTDLNKVDIELSDLTNQFYLQTLFRRDFSLTLGAEHKHLKIISETFVEDEEEETTFDKSDYFGLFGNLKFDTYSDKYFPKSGFFFEGDFHLYLSSSDFNDNFSEFSIAKANIGYVIPFSERFTARLGSAGGFKIGDDSNNSLNFAIGGYGNDLINNFIPFYGYDFISVTGNSFVKGSIDLDFEWIRKHHINFGVNYSNIGEDIFIDGEWFTTPDYSGYAIGYSLDTFLGPLEAKYTWSPENSENFWTFNLGFWF